MRTRQDKIALWTRATTNEASQYDILHLEGVHNVKAAMQSVAQELGKTETEGYNSGWATNNSMVSDSARQVFDERTTRKAFDIILVHNRVKPLCLHDIVCHLSNDLSAGQVFEETIAHQARFQIMIKLLLGKTLMMWVHSGDYVADIKLKSKHMKRILVD